MINIQTDSTFDAMWRPVRQELQKRCETSTFNSWLADVHYKNIEDNTLFLEVGNKFLKGWISQNYTKIIVESWRYIYNTEVNIHFEVTKKKLSVLPLEYKNITNSHFGSVANSTIIDKNTLENPSSQVSDKFSFTKFLVDTSNQLAYSLLYDYATNPIKLTQFNPIFLYGYTGLGKTHLLKSTFNCLMTNKVSKIIYTTAGQFTNQFIQAIKNRTMSDFKSQFQNLDVLIMDDVHFLSNKIQTQQEFLTILDDMIIRNKQVFVSSTLNIAELTKMDTSLVSKLAGGVLVQIEPASHAFKIRVLKEKAAQANITLTPQMIHAILGRNCNNIREIEGVINQFIVQQKLTLSTTTSLTATSFSVDHKCHEPINIQGSINITEIQELVARYYGITTHALMSDSRSKIHTTPRHVAIYIAKLYTKLSITAIGAVFKRNHSTILHSIKYIEKNILLFSADIMEIRTEIANIFQYDTSV